MPQPYSINFGPWVPDGDDVAIAMPNQFTPSELPLADCANVYWSDQGYRSLNTRVASGTALSAQAIAAATALDSSGNPQIYVGTGADLFHWNGSGFTNVSKSVGAYSCSFWSFVNFGGCIIGSNGNQPLQDMTVGGAAFADVAGAPIGYNVGVIGQFLFVGDLTGFRQRVQWSGIGDPTSWPTPLTNAAIAVQSSYEDLTQDFGPVNFIAGGPQRGVILQQLGLTLATYQGGDTVFSFQPFERKRGLLVKGAAVQVGDVTHFLAADGFCLTDGSQVIPTGAATDGSVGLDRWFWANVNMSALSAIRAGYDATLKCVVFAIPTGSATLPNALLLLNPQDRRWTRADANYGTVDCIWPDNDGKRHRLGLFSQTHNLNYLTGAPNAGYVETYDGSFLDGRVRDVVEVQPNIICTDTPTARIGYRESIQDAITYTSDNQQDAFSRRVTFDPPPAGRFIRVRLTSAAATALNGATIFTEMGGGA